MRRFGKRQVEGIAVPIADQGAEIDAHTAALAQLVAGVQRDRGVVDRQHGHDEGRGRAGTVAIRAFHRGRDHGQVERAVEVGWRQQRELRQVPASDVGIGIACCCGEAVDAVGQRRADRQGVDRHGQDFGTVGVGQGRAVGGQRDGAVFPAGVGWQRLGQGDVVDHRAAAIGGNFGRFADDADDLRLAVADEAELQGLPVERGGRAGIGVIADLDAIDGDADTGGISTEAWLAGIVEAEGVTALSLSTDAPLTGVMVRLIVAGWEPSVPSLAW